MDRPLEPGESFYSVILAKGAELVRRDYAASVWKGPPDGCIGWWKSSIPHGDSNKLKPAPAPVLVETLQRLSDIGEQPALAFLLAVHLLRKRVLVPASPQDSIADDCVSTYVYPVDGREIRIVPQHPSPTELESLQKQLVELLYHEV